VSCVHVPMSTEPSVPRRAENVRRGPQERLINAAEILGNKWHPVILHQLLLEGGVGFSDLKHRIDGVSGKMLSQGLTTLEERGLVDRTIINEKPVRVEYSLTNRGASLEPVVEALLEWRPAESGAVDAGGGPDDGVGR